MRASSRAARILSAAALLAAIGGCELVDSHQPPPRPLPPAPTTPALPQSRIRWISTHEALAELRANDDVFLLCVADKEQYDRAHIPGSVLIPVRGLHYCIDNNTAYPEINYGRMPRKDQPIIVYCWWKSCKCPKIPTYSQLARKIMIDKGYRDVAFVNGGMPGWLDDGLPAEGPLLHLWPVERWK